MGEWPWKATQECRGDASCSELPRTWFDASLGNAVGVCQAEKREVRKREATPPVHRVCAAVSTVSAAACVAR